jgi:hypothetical protein
MWHVDTFVVRLWTPADHAAPAGDARGIARHVGTGRWATFRDGAELLALLEELPQLGTTEDDDDVALVTPRARARSRPR